LAKVKILSSSASPYFFAKISAGGPFTIFSTHQKVERERFQLSKIFGIEGFGDSYFQKFSGSKIWVLRFRLSKIFRIEDSGFEIPTSKIFGIEDSGF